MNISADHKDSSAKTEFRLTNRVYFEDTDAAGIVYHANYLKFMERARTEWLRLLGYDQNELNAELQLGFVVRKMTIDFLLPAKLDDEIETVSVLEKCGPASILFDQRVQAMDATLLCKAQVKVGCINLTTQRPSAMPKKLSMEIQQWMPTSQ